MFLTLLGQLLRSLSFGCPSWLWPSGKIDDLYLVRLYNESTNLSAGTQTSVNRRLFVPSSHRSDRQRTCRREYLAGKNMLCNQSSAVDVCASVLHFWGARGICRKMRVENNNRLKLVLEFDPRRVGSLRSRVDGVARPRQEEWSIITAMWRDFWRLISERVSRRFTNN